MAILRPSLIFLLVLSVAYAVAEKPTTPVAMMSTEDIAEQLQECPVVQDLNTLKLIATESASSLTSRLFAALFPGSPAVNALLGTLYISGPPNFLLALCPPNIDPASLSIMVAFAVGGLMGDTLLHLLPEIFLGEDAPTHVRFVMVEPNRNLLLGLGILIGFMTFVAMDKGLRIATGGEGHSYDHAPSHSKSEESTALASGMDSPAKSTRSRTKKSEDSQVAVVEKTVKHEGNPSVKMAGYLNLIADFTHNITDGLAMASSFYASPTLGATTTMAVFFHEIPHEVGDFALLIQSGFSKRAAMGAQFLTALGALLGTIIGIAIQEFSGSTTDAVTGRTSGIWGTSLTWGDMLLPFTAGTFLYVGTVAVIPELLETGSNKRQELKKTLAQFVAIFAGAGIMLAISWS